MIKIGLLEKLTRAIKGIFNSDYRLIDIENHIYNNKPYDVRNQQFFEIARNYQVKHGVSQKTAVNVIHDSFIIKDVIEGKNKSGKSIDKILQDWYFYEQMEYDLGIDMIYDYYE